MFIQTEATPNPATLKFLPGKVVMPKGTFDARNAAGAAPSPLAQRLFEIPGIAGVFFGHDFVTVTKGEGEWQHMKPAILAAIMEHFMSGAPIVIGGTGPAGATDGEEFFDAADAPTVETIKDGVVYLNMKGACSGCPSSTATLKHGIQNLLRHFLPDVREVEAV